MPIATIALVLGGIAFLIALSMMAILYQKCATNQAMIISGLWCGQNGQPFKVVIGGGQFLYRWSSNLIGSLSS